MADPQPDLEPAPGMPRWVKLLAIAAIVVVLLIGGLLLFGGGNHGPGRHLGTAALVQS